jgi:effector-binding domain-containing protein
MVTMDRTLTYTVRDRVLAGRYTAVARGELPGAQLPGWLASAFGAVYDYLRRAGIPPTGPPFARLTFLGETVAVEAGFPVPYEVAGAPGVEPSTLPDGPAAVVTHLGRYEDMDRAYQAARDWLAERGLAPAGPHWEVYYTDPNAEPDPSRWRTDVVVPYRAGGRN